MGFKLDSHWMRLDAYACVCVKKRIHMRKTTQWCAMLGVKGSRCEALRKKTHVYAEYARASKVELGSRLVAADACVKASIGHTFFVCLLRQSRRHILHHPACHNDCEPKEMKLFT